MVKIQEVHVRLELRSDLAGESEILGEHVVGNHVELLLLLALHVYAAPAAFVSRHSSNACTVHETSNHFACLDQNSLISADSKCGMFECILQLPAEFH
jgi:hypothetical protein